MNAGLTPKMARCLEAVKRLTKGDVSPSYDELMADLGVASRGGIHRMLHSLQERGYVELRPRQARSITVLTDDRKGAPNRRNLEAYDTDTLHAIMGEALEILLTRARQAEQVQ